MIAAMTTESIKFNIQRQRAWIENYTLKHDNCHIESCKTIIALLMAELANRGDR
jgi:hypothetical protein